MKYEELIDYAKSVFNFHPDEKFESLEHILEAAKKNIGSHEHYLHGTACLVEVLVRYADKNRFWKGD